MTLVPNARAAPGAEAGSAAQATVIIFNRNPIAGRVLELLRTADYAVRYVFDDLSGVPGTLDGVRVMHLGPGWDARSYDALVKAVGGAPELASFTILELGGPYDGGRAEPRRHVPWPCRAEDLTRRIDAALRAETERDAGAREDRR